MEDKGLLIQAIVDGMRSIIVHYGMWFNEVEHQLGLETALRLEEEVWRKNLPLQMNRLAKILKFDIKDGVPAALGQKSAEELSELMQAVAVNWLANDGLWFQAVENHRDMFTAKRCNDTCWSRFSPFEAHRIMRLCELPVRGGIAALQHALGFRLYARINEQSFEKPDDNTLIFRMNRCRVQETRRRKGLPDYPCKSGGLVEYSSFAQAIDPRLITDCIACPPDGHPPEWFCCWKFTLPNA